MTEQKISTLKRFNRLINLITGSLLGVCIGRSIFVYWEYLTYPGLYEMQSAPWYTSILVCGIFVAVVLVIATILKCILHKLLKNGGDTPADNPGGGDAPAGNPGGLRG